MPWNAWRLRCAGRLHSVGDGQSRGWGGRGATGATGGRRPDRDHADEWAAHDDPGRCTVPFSCFRAACHAGSAMIAFPVGVKVWIAGGITDVPCGMNSLLLKVRGLRRDPHGGALFCFRSRKGDLIEVLCRREP
ncbi:hypothetical protein D2T31_19595 [Sinirhodobacter populi]|uniref:Transposase n=2 Tax=Paenirhodobacter populi TaxID=2306993 RepID=A0A443K177_9RHOB|nr:hypothetical protein D2T31_19595 [Sinirhodobacter populi]